MLNQELIDKLRAAETGSPELSAEVLSEFYPDFIWMPDSKYSVGGGYRKMRGSKLEKKPWHDVTQSIDAALTLVPDNMDWAKFDDRIELIKWHNMPMRWAEVIARAEHKQTAIAICIAVLSANKQREVG